MKAILSVFLLAVLATALVLPLSENSVLAQGPPQVRREVLHLHRNSSKILRSLKRPLRRSSLLRPASPSLLTFPSSPSMWSPPRSTATLSRASRKKISASSTMASLRP